ncbi:MAG TPA: ATP-binding protein [Actinomycetota bacterium]|nr:ATP-binding protein [Actinomycetota bacterium]
MKVLLCDAPEGLALLQYALLRSSGEIEVEVTVDSFRAVELAVQLQPDVAVLEIDLAGVGGRELVQRILERSPRTKVLCWSGVVSAHAAAEMLTSGAAGYLLKEDGADEVVRALHTVLAGGVTLSRRVAALMAEKFSESLRRDRQLEESLAEVNDRLDEVNSAKAEFLANVSHELRTPVTVAKGIAYVLKNRELPDTERREFVGQLESSLEKLMRIVDGMLQIAELDRGAVSLHLRSTDIVPIVRRAAEDVANQYPNVEIEVRLPEELVAMADAGRIDEVTKQLLDNACRYSPPEEGVTIRGRMLDEGILVTVTDRGEGIPREVATRAFNEPFSTGEETLRKERAGIGLGLHLARRLIAQHEGIIWADPLPGGGTRVSFLLPREGHKLTRRPVIPNEGPDLTGAGEPDDEAATA